MSHAKGHHFLPQFLLGGFASRISRNQKYAFVFRKETAPAEPNIKDIAKQRYFHGNPDESDLEHVTSVRESAHATLIGKLRNDDILPAYKPQIDELVIHLGLRTRNLRDGLTATGETLFDALEDHISGVVDSKPFEATLMKTLKEQIESPPLRDLLSMLPVETRSEFLLQAIRMAKSPELRDRIRKWVQEMRGGVNFSAMVEKTHLKVLSADQIEVAIQTRKEQFAGLTWYLTRHPIGTFILGDVGPFAKYRNSSEYTQIIRVEGILDAIVLPISSTHLLIGQRDGFAVDLEAKS